MRHDANRWVLTLSLSLVLGGGPFGHASVALAEDQNAPPGDQGTPPGTNGGDNGDIQKRLEELEQEVSAGKARDAATVGAGKDGFFIRSADGSNQLRIRGYVQSDAQFSRDDETQPATDTFLIRRARPIFEGTVNKIFDFRIVPDFGEGKTVLQEASLDWRLSTWARLMVGKYKAPFGLERLQSARDILFVVRAEPTNLVPNRDIGIEFHGDPLDGAVSYALGVFNGVADGASADADTNDGKEEAARVFFLPFKRTSVAALQKLGIGVAATYGTNKGTPTATGLSPYKGAVNLNVFSYLSDGTAAGTTVAAGRRYRLSPQAFYYLGRLGALAEYVTSSQEVKRGTSEDDLHHAAWQVAASFLLTHDQASFTGVSPKKPFDPGAHTWGAFEIVARVDRLKIDDDSFPIYANPATSVSEAKGWAAGVNWYLSKNVKIMLDCLQTRFEGGAATGNREDEKVILNRFQIAF